MELPESDDSTSDSGPSDRFNSDFEARLTCITSILDWFIGNFDNDSDNFNKKLKLINNAEVRKSLRGKFYRLRGNLKHYYHAIQKARDNKSLVSSSSEETSFEVADKIQEMVEVLENYKLDLRDKQKGESSEECKESQSKLNVSDIEQGKPKAVNDR